MAGRISWRLVLSVGFLAAAPLTAQDMPDPQAMQGQVQRIVRERPREAEAAARAFLMLVAPDRVSGLDSLKAQSESRSNQPQYLVDGVPVAGPSPEYWFEVAQLTVQFTMVQNLTRRDSVRADLVARMFGLEAQARARQRAYRPASEATRAKLRGEIESLISQHFDLEEKLRALEVADIERRLAEVRAETQRRRERRAEFIKWAVDDIIRDATRPQ
ncbi:MAG TPA: hypothetical protein VGQ48_10595 [Gemmatimonadales bacterium]|jgi:hypothetical protein|nr:hypothetical protein [Gemmatimonadales bacterium]